MKKLRDLAALSAIVGLIGLITYAGVLIQAPTPAYATRYEDTPAATTTSGVGDSSTFTIYQRTDAQRVADTGPKDTTAWLNIGGLSLPDCNFAGQQLLKFTLTSSTAVSGDSIGYVMQWSNDQSTIFSASKAYVTGVGPYNVIALTCDTNANAPAYGYRYLRWILSDEDQSLTTSLPTCTASLRILRKD